MAINPVQPNIENTKSHIPYREAKGTIKTDKNVKPLPPEGHLVHDSWTMLPKYFQKNILQVPGFYDILCKLSELTAVLAFA